MKKILTLIFLLISISCYAYYDIEYSNMKIIYNASYKEVSYELAKQFRRRCFHKDDKENYIIYKDKIIRVIQNKDNVIIKKETRR